MKLKNYLNESENVVVTDWLQQVEQTYKKYFPKSYINASLRNILGQCIFIDPYIAKDKSECPHGYFENDMFHISFSILDPKIIKDENENLCFDGDQVLECSSSFFCIKSEDRYRAFDRKKVPFRKTKGSPEKLLQVLDKYFKKLKDSLQEEIDNDNIRPEDLELLKSKI